MEIKIKIKPFPKIKVAQFTKEGKLIKIWDSQKEASKGTGVVQPSISACCYGKLNTAGNFKWCFV